jgi:hypothetical protein
MYEGGDGLLITAQDPASVVLRQIAQEVPDRLPGQVIEQVRMAYCSVVRSSVKGLKPERTSPLGTTRIRGIAIV